MLKNILLVVMLLITLTSLRLVGNTAGTIQHLQREVTDRDYALQITASAINTCQEWLDRSREKAKNYKAATEDCVNILAQCMQSYPDAE